MDWFTTDDVDSFLSEAGQWLRADPVPHTLVLTIVETVRRRGATAYGQVAPRFGWCRSRQGPVEAAFVHTPPHPLVMTPASAPAAAALAGVLAADGWPVPGINALPEPAQAFAKRWCASSGEDSRVHRRMRLYRLEHLVAPDPGPPGQARVARAADRDLLVAWYEEFASELGETAHGSSVAVDERIDYGGLSIWEVDGSPVSMAGHSPIIAAMSRIGPVYTPPVQRRHGYGAAVTEAASRAALAAGAGDVALFTDLANPTSNAIYQQIGYRPLHDRAVVEFGRPHDGHGRTRPGK